MISVVLSFTCAFQRLYLTVLSVAVFLFVSAVTLWTLRVRWWFVVHMGFHCVACTSNVILYAGRYQSALERDDEIDIYELYEYGTYESRGLQSWLGLILNGLNFN